MLRNWVVCYSDHDCKLFLLFQDIVIVDENLNNTDTEMRGDADFLSKTIITDSSLGECKMVASLND